ncbi:type II secretion system secretin GspD [Falsiroseomonas sp. CW058]|uniref:type II secretion system secretin GspD n=1 Tax=Falsiroseomonas sp. CW058 TaxID=3388664 RepID=UPI003D313AB1
MMRGLLLALLLLPAACAEPRGPRTPSAFDETMRQIAEARAGAGPALAPTSLPGAAATPRPRRPLAVLDSGLPGGRPARAAPPPGVAGGGDGTVTLNFVEAELASAVQAVLGDLLGADYTIDPRLSGTVTLQTQRPVGRDAAVSLLEAALAANGAALIGDAGGSWRVVPLDAALQSGPPAAIRGAAAQTGRGFRVIALPLAHASAADLQRVLQPLSPRGGAVVADEARNILLLAGTGPQLATLIETAETFDSDWVRGQSIALVPLESAPAALVAQELNTLFETGGARREGLRVMAVARMNALLVVAARPEQVQRVRRWAAELDSGLGAGPQLYVHPVQYVRATDLATTLRQLLQGNGRGPAAALLAPGQSGALAIAGTAAPAAPAGGEAPAGGAPAQPGAAPGEAPGEGGGASNIRIVAEETQNALIVYATPTDWRLVERAILALDRPPNQVAIDALIAEVTLTDDLEYGLSWFFRAGNFDLRFGGGPSAAPAPGFPGLNLLYSGGVDAGAVLRALSSVTEVRVISSPQVMVLSNQTARLRVGDSVPIVTQQATGSTFDSRTVNSVQLRDTGVALDVTPRVNSAGGVMLEVDQDVSDAVRTTTSGIDSPTIQQRRLRSVVSVPSGETIALGGLIREGDTNGRSGVPFVDQVPVLRELLGTTARNRRRTELLVLITPRVVQSAEEMRRVTEEIRLRMRSMAPRPM